MARFTVRVWDQQALTPTGRCRGRFVPQFETDSISEAGRFMEEQTVATSLHVDGRMSFILYKEEGR